LARRAITATIVVVVTAVVATAMAAVAVLVPVATVVVVAASGWARRCGGRWLGCRGHSVGVEHRWGSRMTCTIHVDLLQYQVVLNFEKVRERRVAPNNGAHVLEALVQPSKNVEDEDPIFDGGT
jgi:hypothetical protein